jgi:xanthine dehydrogenase iron-sulfur cluster and FAD-binding subunit A
MFELVALAVCLFLLCLIIIARAYAEPAYIVVKLLDDKGYPMATISTEQKVTVVVTGKSAAGKVVSLDGGTLAYSVNDSNVGEVVDELGVPKLVGKAAGMCAVIVTWTKDDVVLTGTSESISVTEATVASIEVTLGAIENQ